MAGSGSACKIITVIFATLRRAWQLAGEAMADPEENRRSFWRRLLPIGGGLLPGGATVAAAAGAAVEGSAALE